MYQSVIVSLIIVIIGGWIYFAVKSDDREKKSSESDGTREENEVESLNKGLEGVFIQVRIKEQTSEGEFKDSLYYTPEEWLRIAPDDVRKSIQKRVENWVTSIKGVPAQ